MPRIRTIKPEFWWSEQILSCSRDARLLFIGLWNFCDDSGIHPVAFRTIKTAIFGGDEISLDQIKYWISELIEQELLVEFEVQNKRYWQVTGWNKHQRIDHPNQRHPLPQAGLLIKKECSLSELRGTFCECSENIPRTLHTGIEGKGREWNKLMSSCPQTDQPVDNLGAGQLDHVALNLTNRELKKKAIGILELLNEKANRKFRMNETNLKFIMQRLKSGATDAQCRQIIVKKCREWNEDTKMSNYLRPETLFNKTKFESYLGELVLTQEKNEKPTIEKRWEVKKS